MPECQKLKIEGYASMALNPLNSSNLEQLALKGLKLTALAKLINEVNACHLLGLNLAQWK